MPAHDTLHKIHVRIEARARVRSITEGFRGRSITGGTVATEGARLYMQGGYMACRGHMAWRDSSDRGSTNMCRTRVEFSLIGDTKSPNSDLIPRMHMEGISHAPYSIPYPRWHTLDGTP